MVLRSLIQTVSALSFAGILLVSATVPSSANEGRWHHRDRDRSGFGIHQTGLPSHIRNLGTFSGGILGLRIRGIGNYFYIAPMKKTKVVMERPKAKVLSVNGTTSDCSMENGVCVIRAK